MWPSDSHQAMSVVINGRDYVPAIAGPPPPPAYRLTLEHFDAAAELPDSFEAIKWAWEAEATVREMQAWSRALHGPPEPTPQPDKKRPLELPRVKKALF